MSIRKRDATIGKITKNDLNNVRNVNQFDEKSGSDQNVTTKVKTNPQVYVVFLSLLLDLLSFTMILPLLPSLLEHYRKHDHSGLYNKLSESIKYFQEMLGAPDKYNSVLFGGFLGSMFSLLQFIASPIVGALSDCYGRKPIMLICMLGIALSYGLWAISTNFTIFVVARFVGGISKGNVSLSMAILTDVSNEKNRGKAMALVGIAFSLGFIFGPMIGAGFAKFSDKTSESWFWYPAIFATSLIIADIFFLIIFLKETLPKENRSRKLISSISEGLEHISIPSLFKFAPVKDLPKIEIDSLKKLGFIYFIYLFIYSGLEFTITFLMFHKFGYTSIDQAKMFLTTGIVMTLLQGTVVRRLPSHLTKRSAVMGLYLIIPAFIVVGLAKDSLLLYTGMILYAISTAFVVTCMTILTSQYGNADQKGIILGIFRSLGALARAIGPIAASIAFWSIGSTCTYILGGFLLFIPSLFLQYSKIS